MSVSAPDMENYVDVAAVEEIPEGEGCCYEIDGHAIAIFCDEGTFYAVSDTCTHEEYSLSAGFVWDHTVECPKHGARFDLATGEVLSLPATVSVESYPVEVRDRRILVAVPSQRHRGRCPTCYDSRAERWQALLG
jgi:3-phenylpropionate/trans-cinnamate dioxygenase ferredoxin component